MSNFNSSSHSSTSSSPSHSPLSFECVSNEPETECLVEHMELINGLVRIYIANCPVVYMSPSRVRAMDIRLNDVVRMAKNIIFGVCLEKREAGASAFITQANIPLHGDFFEDICDNLDTEIQVLGFVVDSLELYDDYDSDFTNTGGLKHVLNRIFGRLCEIKERVETVAA